YSPGDLVKGAVVLTAAKPIRLSHLTVCLHGYVRVFKSPNGVNDPIPDLGLTASSNPRKSQYFGNGHASLFQDEVTLCGEGRLDIGVYEFNFELEFPRKGLPSSVDFERGTISYLITATMTRPTSITAISRCDQKLAFVETVDIGPMQPPKPQKISLEPISRLVRRRKTVKTNETGLPENTDAGAGSGSDAARVASPVPDDSASQCGSVDRHITGPRSPVPSQAQSTGSAGNSAGSAVSSSTGLSFRLGAVPASAKSAKGSPSKRSPIPLADQSITASIELLKSGCLPGDNLPLKISIKHTKALKSVHGIIITFYRQGRIDSAPPLSLFADIKGKDAERLKHEEYYPKSKTGLGGLSLTSAGSSSIFRKDLAQTFAPILVDPTSLTAVVNASIRVPEDVFPTISGVPGQMITFRYHVEVVVDLGGKLAGQQRHVPRLGAITLPASFGTSAAAPRDGNPNLLAAWGGSIVDTANIRREKSVVECRFEVVVGTKDTARKRARGNSSVRRQVTQWSDEMGPVLAPTHPSTHEPIYEESVATNEDQHSSRQHQYPYPYYDRPPDHPHPDYAPSNNYSHEDRDLRGSSPPREHDHIHVPPPEMEIEGALGEKERLRRAEERLLPSQPPVDGNAPSSSRTVVPPFLSALPGHEEDLYSPDDATPRHDARRDFPPLFDAASGSHSGPSAPTLDDLGPTSGSNATDDKQELERRRLMEETSAPPDFFADEDDNAGEGSSRQLDEPSAPPILDYDEYGNHYSHHPLPELSSARETLPKYER
ncbi:arrestin domain-containing protein, partial [Diplocarpon rosae]